MAIYVRFCMILRYENRICFSKLSSFSVVSFPARILGTGSRNLWSGTRYRRFPTDRRRRKDSHRNACARGEARGHDTLFDIGLSTLLPLSWAVSNRRAYNIIYVRFTIKQFFCPETGTLITNEFVTLTL